MQMNVPRLITILVGAVIAAAPIMGFTA